MATTEEVKVKVSVDNLQSLDTLKDKTEKAKNAINLLASSILGVSFGAFIGGAIQSADRIADLSDATGLAVSSILNFGNALDQAGGKSRNAEKIILSFFQNIEGALAGSDKLRESFAKVGISLDDLKNKSEAQLLGKTLEELAKMDEGSRRSALQTELLSKAFRGVDATKFVNELKAGKITAEEAAVGIIAGANAADEMAKKFAILQQGSLLAIAPVLKLFGETELTANSAAKAVTFVGIALGLAFGASTLASIVKLNQALLATGAISTLVGKNPVVKFLAIAGLAALEGAAAYGAYSAATKELEAEQKRLEEQAKKTAEAVGGKPSELISGKKEGGDAGRVAGISPKEQAAIDSNKRIAQHEIDSAKYAALQSEEIKLSAALLGANDVMAISIKSNSDIALARINSSKDLEKQIKDIQSNRNIDAAQQEKEISSLRKESAAKLALDIQKINDNAAKAEADYRLKLNARIFTEEQAQRDESAVAVAAYEDKVNASRTTALEQVRALSQGNDELKLRLDFQNSSIGLSTIERDYQQKLLDLTIDRTEKLRQLNLIKDLPNDDRLQKEKELNAEYERRIQLLDLQRQRELERQTNFTLGWEKSYNNWMESTASAFAYGERQASNFTRGIEDAFIKFAQTGKLSFKDLVNTMIAELIRFQIATVAKGIGGSAGLFGALGKLFNFGGSDLAGASVLGLPGYAAGGMVPAGQLSIVGERGPELFIPRSSGNIIPNDRLSQTTSQPAVTNVNYNIQAVDAASFRQLVARDPSFIYAVTEQGRRSQPTRR